MLKLLITKTAKQVLLLGLFTSAVVWSGHAGNERKELQGHVPPAVSRLTPQGRLPASRQLYLAIGLPLRDPAALEAFLRQLYDPQSPGFRQYLSPAEFAERFGPTEADYQAVIQFAEANGFTVTARQGNRVVLDVQGAAADIERAFHINLRNYHHPQEDRDFFAPDVEPSVPADLPVVDIQGLSDFNRPHSHSRVRPMPADNIGAKANAGSGPFGGTYRGNDFRAAYVPGTSLTGSNQVVGLVQFDGYYTNDIIAYESQAGLPNVPLQKISLDGYDGTPFTGPNSGNGEVSLDIEMVISMAPGIAKLIVYEGNPTNFIPNDVLSRIATDNQAKQVSSSWSWTGGPQASTDALLSQMAAQGQSYFQASGDSDAYTGSNVLDLGSNFTTPIASPYVTAVGGTTLTTTGPGGAWSGETVWNWNTTGQPNVGSSGGISVSNTIPSWQAFISMTSNHGSTSMRNVPDVALTADNVYVVYNNGSSNSFGGTSCAAPLWAGFCALLNQQAALAQKPAFGLLNPTLYGLATNANYTTLFHDITTGNNIGTNTPGLFNAVAGYDLCTGLGTPNGTNLINYLAPLGILVVNNGSSLQSESATPANGAIDPGETVAVGFNLKNIGGVATSNLVATLTANAGVLAPSGPQTYGALAAFGGSASRSFTFTAAGACGSNIVAMLQLQDGTNNLGAVSFTLPLGQSVNIQAISQNFDGVAAPALPSGWVTVTVSGSATNKWATTTVSNYSSPNSAFCPANSAISGQNALVSPAFSIVSSSAKLFFQHNYSFEYKSGSTHPYRDGGVLEIKIGSGSFADILAAGGSFVAGGYTNSISSGAGTSNPLGGRSAWVKSSLGWKPVTVNLPASAAGQTIQLRWNCATDGGNSGTGAVGWYVDSISITDAVPTCLTVQADLAVGQLLAPASLQAGQNLIYTLAVTNLGPQSAANVTMTDTVPANVTFVAASPGCTYSAGNLVCPVGMMTVGASTNFSLTLAPTGGVTFTNLVAASTVTPESGTANDTSVLVSTQVASVPPAITTGPVSQTIECGGNASFSIMVTGTPPLSIQWSLDSVPTTGATNTSLSLTSVHMPNHTVSVTVTNLYGSVTSNALMTVHDTLPPVITLNGTNPVYLNVGDTFADPGATASDACAGSVPVTVSGSVSSSVAGTNVLIYTAGDVSGNTNATTRTVIVRPLTSSVGLASSVSPSGYRDALTFTATITPTSATGTVQFLTNGFGFDLKTVSGGIAASTSLSALPRGTNGISAIYSGDARYLPSTNSIQQIVTNHPPTGGSMIYTNGANFTLTIPISDLASNWSDLDGDQVSLVAAGTSTNGITVTNTGTALVYSNANSVPDQFLCTIADNFGGTNFQVVAIVPAPPQVDPTPLIEGVTVGTNQSVVLVLGGEPGRTYVLENRPDLEPSSIWLPIATNILGTNGLWQFTDPKAASSPEGYYRLKLLP
jgi:uncharacterized repeat protein (TIGR01451 family)